MIVFFFFWLSAWDKRLTVKGYNMIQCQPWINKPRLRWLNWGEYHLSMT